MAQTTKCSLTPESILADRARVDAFTFKYDAARSAATQKLVSFRFLRGDLHTHSLYSDGTGTVAQNWAVAQQRGLDFIFATDHETVRQKAACRKFETVWWGQEPGLRTQHVCILDNKRRFVPRYDLGVDARRLRKLGVFFFFPHPVGWFPDTHYAPDAIAALDDAGPAFAIEIMNGIFRTDPFFSEWEAGCLEVWDTYLRRGCRVIGLAASDAHMPASVGNVWTGVLGARRRKHSVLKALRAGRVFASSGPAVNLTAGNTPMGAAARPRNGKITIHFECADAYGLQWVRVIQDGRRVKRIDGRGKPRIAAKLALPIDGKSRYVRVECAAQDDRRAYTNPIFIAR